MMMVWRFLQHRSHDRPTLVTLVPVSTMPSRRGQLSPTMEATSSSHCAKFNDLLLTLVGKLLQ